MKKVGRFIGGILKGAIKGVVPNVVQEFKRVEMKDAIKSIQNNQSGGNLKSQLGRLIDLIDDGKINDSYERATFDAMVDLISGGVVAGITIYLALSELGVL